MKTKTPYLHQRDLAARFAALPAAPEADRLRLGAGTAADYASLSGYHYRAARPATMMRILTLRDPEPTIAERFRGGSRKQGDQRPGAGEGVAVAVLVESLPALSCKLRDLALRGRYTELDARQRGRLLNSEVRCISRVIVDPRYRGMGLAVKLVREALATADTPYTEALAAMGLASPFFEKAGMTCYTRPPHTHDERLLAALAHCNIDPTALATHDDWRHTADTLAPDQRAWLRHELSRWYRAGVGRSANASHNPDDHLRAAQQKLFSQPVYYLHDNRGGCNAQMAKQISMTKPQ